MISKRTVLLRPSSRACTSLIQEERERRRGEKAGQDVGEDIGDASDVEEVEAALVGCVKVGLVQRHFFEDGVHGWSRGRPSPDRHKGR